jgi:serine kinase of HPr protein (carbohydrate metabolism regulator)
MIQHGGLIARFDRGRWRAVLLEGPSGSGKSDVALRAVAAGWSLVADDRTLMWASEGRLYGRAPDTLAGLIEIRGVGVLTMPFRAFAEIVMAARCVGSEAVERQPSLETKTFLGVSVPLISLAAHEASASAKIGRALSILDSVGNRRIKRPALAEFSPDAEGVP